MARKNRFSARFKRDISDAGAFLKGKKVYIASFLGLGVVGLAAALLFNGAGTNDGTDMLNSANRNGVNQINMYALPTEDTRSVSKSEDENLVQVLGEALNAQNGTEPTLMPEFTEAPKKNTAPSVEKMIAPTDGEVIWDYAVDSLIFSRTLSQWMTHSGVDVAAPKGTEVYALADGVIENVYTDDLLGVSVVLVHEDGMMSVYANLKEEPPVKEGQLVKKRDVIGYVGNTAISECMEESHLHLELYRDGMTVDPKEYIRFDKTDIE